MTSPPDDPQRQRIRAVVDSIPLGRVATYGQVAREAGLPRRPRLVGAVLAALSPRSALPWHRVLGATGRISPRPGPGPTVQRRRLEREGVRFDSRGRVDLQRFGWNPAAPSARR